MPSFYKDSFMTIKKGDVLICANPMPFFVQLHVVMEVLSVGPRGYAELSMLLTTKSMTGYKPSEKWMKRKVLYYPYDVSEKLLVRSKARLNIIYKSILQHLYDEKKKQREDIGFFERLYQPIHS
jgi:hypothetical protein